MLFRSEQSTTDVAKQEFTKEFEEALSATGRLEVEMEDLRKIHEEKSQVEELTSQFCHVT